MHYQNAYSLPHIDETLDCLGGAIIFMSLDLKSGYWQVKMHEESKPLTACTFGPLGFYECERMPFGLTNAPATFQCLMKSCLGESHLSWCIIHLDDIMVFSKTLEEHLKRLRGVFEKLAKAGLKFKPSTCESFLSKIAYLGHIVSTKGIKTDPKKIEAKAGLKLKPSTCEFFLSNIAYLGHIVSTKGIKADPKKIGPHLIQ